MVYRKRVYRKKGGSRLKKRDFYASANLGAFGKYAFGYKTKRSLSSKVKSIVRRDLETPMHLPITDTLSNANLLHNGFQSMTFLDNITPGTSNQNRVGDVIHLDAIKYNIMLTNETANGNQTTFRLMLVKKDIRTLTGGLFTSVLGSSDLYVNGTGNVFATCGILDPKRTTVLFDTEVTLKPSINNQLVTKCLVGTIKIDQRYVYIPGQSFGKDYNIYWVIIATQANATSGVTPVGKMYVNNDIIFKNSV